MKNIDRIIKETISDYAKDLLDSTAQRSFDDELDRVERSDPKKRKYMYKKFLGLGDLDNNSKSRRDANYTQGQDDDL